MEDSVEGIRDSVEGLDNVGSVLWAPGIWERNKKRRKCSGNKRKYGTGGRSLGSVGSAVK